jgi:hypothetical protein
MRIVENTPARLVLRNRTLWLSWGLFGLAAVLMVPVVSHPNPQEFLVAALCAACGAVFLRATDVTFDRARRTCALRRLDIWRVMRVDLSFDDILDVQIDTLTDEDRPPTCRLSLVTTSGTVPLTASYQPTLERFTQMRQAAIDAVFADRTQPAAEDPVVRLVRAGRTIDAIALLRQRDGLDLASAHSRVHALRERLSD